VLLLFFGVCFVDFVFKFVELFCLLCYVWIWVFYRVIFISKVHSVDCKLFMLRVALWIL
jgi:hypothetical protein